MQPTESKVLTLAQVERIRASDIEDLLQLCNLCETCPAKVAMLLDVPLSLVPDWQIRLRAEIDSTLPSLEQIGRAHV